MPTSPKSERVNARTVARSLLKIAATAAAAMGKNASNLKRISVSGRKLLQASLYSLRRASRQRASFVTSGQRQVLESFARRYAQVRDVNEGDARLHGSVHGAS